MSSEKLPKHLLPVAGVPSILRLLGSLANFPQIVICIHSQDNVTLDVIQEMATLTKEEDSTWTLESKTRKQIILVLKVNEECFGSVDAIRHVETKKIINPKTRMVVIPGDLVFLKNDLDLDALLRPAPNSAYTSLLVDVGEVDEHGVPLKESAKVSFFSFFTLHIEMISQQTPPNKTL
jgi:NDP-sugar pyrophosphorylase family protein